MKIIRFKDKESSHIQVNKVQIKISMYLIINKK